MSRGWAWLFVVAAGCVGGPSSSSSSSGGNAPGSGSSSVPAGASSTAQGASSVAIPASSSAGATSIPAASSSGGSGLSEGNATLTGTAAFAALTTFALTTATQRTVYMEETNAGTCQNPLPPSAIHRLLLVTHADGGALLPVGNYPFAADGPWTLALSTLQSDGGYEETSAVGGTLALTENSGARCKGYFTAVHLLAANQADGGLLTGAFNAGNCP